MRSFQTDLYRYKYDEASQLVREDNCVTNQTTTWQYDVGGNIRFKRIYALTAFDTTPTNPIDEIPYVYSTGIWKDLLTSYDGQSITYDASGNPTSYLGATMSWTMGRQLASYNRTGLSIQYTYNENGIRTSKTVNNVRTDYYLIGSQVIAEVTNGNRIDYRYDGNGQLIALRYDGNEYYYITNIQDDIIGLMDGSGTGVVQYTYDAWGNQTSCTGTLANTLGQANPYRYRGYRFDNESELYYLQSRYYDAQVGRFVNADDLSMLAMSCVNLLGSNMFTYCYNNPVINSDPTGMIVPLIIAGIAFSAAEVIAIAILFSFCFLYVFNINGFRTTVNNAVTWAINGIVTTANTIQKKFSQLGTWAAGVIASLVAAYTIAKADARIRDIVKRSSRSRYWSATLRTDYVDIGRVLSFEQAKSELRKGNNVFTVTSTEAFALACVVGNNRTPEDPKKHGNGAGYYYHYHTYDHNGGHVFFLFW